MLALSDCYASLDGPALSTDQALSDCYGSPSREAITGNDWQTDSESDRQTVTSKFTTPTLPLLYIYTQYVCVIR